MCSCVHACLCVRSCVLACMCVGICVRARVLAGGRVHVFAYVHVCVSVHGCVFTCEGECVRELECAFACVHAYNVYKSATFCECVCVLASLRVST